MSNGDPLVHAGHNESVADNLKTNDPLKDSCGFALDLIKQFLTLSAAGIAFIVGLVYADKPGKLSEGSVMGGLILFGASILFGWLAFMAIVGKVNKEKSYDVYGRGIQVFCVLQILLFCGGVLMLFSPTLQTARAQEKKQALSTRSPLSQGHATPPSSETN
jgi:hypothetical protein